MLPPHRVLVPEAGLAARVEALAGEIRDALAGEIPDALARDSSAGDELLVVGVLTGSFVFVADLVRALSRRGLAVRVDFAWTSSYAGDGRPSEAVSVLRDLGEDPAGRRVLLVDDILDTGRTLAVLRDRIAERRPAWLRTCVLLDKPSGRTEAVAADFAGFPAPDGWVFGYGMDTDGQGRELPFLAVRTGSGGGSHHLD